MAFSQGAGLAAFFVIHCEQIKQPQPFRRAISSSGGVSVIMSDGKLGLVDQEKESALIDLPTAHIWGKNDRGYPSFQPMLSQVCA